ncbi:holo-ACP synthase [Thorsellia kenyensis]|uniref:Holo-[acyl-carrier-protein] synthase n=1 Tax=Thorsellia kenyensis TaxID=1549888 RepID=A0ABV6CBA1_9GAMM
MKTGIDLIEIERIKIALNRSGKKLEKMIFTQDELLNIGDVFENIERAAGYWATKEAAVKALGTGFNLGITFQNIEILYSQLGAPYLKLNGKFEEQMLKAGLKASNVSISHTKNYAVAIVNLW